MRIDTGWRREEARRVREKVEDLLREEMARLVRIGCTEEIAESIVRSGKKQATVYPGLPIR